MSQIRNQFGGNGLKLKMKGWARNLSLTAEMGKKKGLHRKLPEEISANTPYFSGLSFWTRPDTVSQGTVRVHTEHFKHCLYADYHRRVDKWHFNPLIFFLNFQFSWSLMRRVDAISKPQLITTSYRSNEIISLSASQHTFRRDTPQHHMLWIYRRNDDFTKGGLSFLPTLGRRAVVFSSHWSQSSFLRCSPAASLPRLWTLQVWALSQGCWCNATGSCPEVEQPQTRPEGESRAEWTWRSSSASVQVLLNFQEKAGNQHKHLHSKEGSAFVLPWIF